MAESWIPGALMGHTVDIDGGARVRLRLARSSDARALAELLAHHESPLNGTSPAQLLEYDPRDRYVICATALIDGAVRLVGVGAIDLGPAEDPEPDLLIVDPEFGGALASLMWRALVGVAQARRPRAA